MKRVLKVGVSILMVSMILMTLAGCGYKKAGDFLLEKKGDGYAIVDLSEEGYQKKELFIYKQIGRYNITMIGFRGGGLGLFAEEAPIISSQALEKIYFVDYVPSGNRDTFAECKNLKRIIRQDSFEFVSDEYYFISSFPLDGSRFRDINQYINHQDFLKREYADCVFPANVSFYLNYEMDGSNGYHWIDDYDYGTRVTYIPEEPEREGYVFGGWYKEEDCINKWDFETDTLPKAILDEETGEPVYQETKLYAKWIRE